MIHLRQTLILRFLIAPNNRLSFLSHHDRSSPRPELSSQTSFLQPRPPRSGCLTSFLTAFTSSTVMAHVKILVIPLNPSSSKRQRLILQGSSTESSESNVVPVAVETNVEREVPFLHTLSCFNMSLKKKNIYQTKL